MAIDIILVLMAALVFLFSQKSFTVIEKSDFIGINFQKTITVNDFKKEHMYQWRMSFFQGVTLFLF